MSVAPKGLTCVIGLGWGDEGKGKVVDLLCAVSDFVVRYNGGANAGHTVCAEGEKFALHLLPTGVLHEHVTACIGPGVVVDPLKLVDEIDGLARRGIDVTPRLRISDRAHLVLVYHRIEDQLTEQSAGESGKIGTTARGIGPCYADKMRRTTAVRFADLLHEADLESRVRDIVTNRKTVLRAMFGEDGGLDADAVVSDIARARERLSANVADTTALLHEAIEGGKRVLFEGANGILLDVDHGTYPFVTSSGTGSYGMGGGAGVWPGHVSRIIGVCKAYATRVGSGPFVTELTNETGDRIRVGGNEFGTTTGRPRRCGWFDAIACRYATRLAGVTDLALLHLDTLSGFEEIGVCVGYSLDGETWPYPPAHTQLLERVEPVFEMLPGWTEDLRNVRRYEDLPSAARHYVERIEDLVGVGASIIGVGPDRLQTLLRGSMQDMLATSPTAPH